MQNKTVVIIVGPTAVGKTAFAVKLAHQFNTEIISADSRQCFRELNIGVAKPAIEEQEGVVHHFIDSHSIEETVTAATFETYALAALEKIFQQHDIAIVTGGTGLYVRALISGFDIIPAVPDSIREEVRALYHLGGLAALTSALQQEDPLFASEGEMENPQRMMRALEVKRASGQSIKSFQQSVKSKRDFNIIQIGLEIPRSTLYENINLRVDEMMKKGLLEEVNSLVQWRNKNALQTVGYKELFEYLDGTISLDKAVEKIKQNTRRYAKRQLTWFKADPSITWFRPDELEAIADKVKHDLRQTQVP